MLAYLALAAAQLLYTASDLGKKLVFKAQGLNPTTFSKPAFIAALALAGIGFVFQMYSLSKIDLSRMAVMIGVMAVVFSSAAGVLVLKESFNVWNGLGVALAVGAIILVNVK